MSRIIVGPFNRVEGDLEVTLEMDGNSVISAEVNSTLFRGFESMLLGRKAMDVLVFAPRICGICSISQSVAAATALSQIYGVSPTKNGQKAINIMLANENSADLLTHFYLFFMPDFAREVYQDKPWFNQVNQRFKAMKGSSSSHALQARSSWMKMMGVLAGHWPHTLAIQPGGTSKAITESETVQLILLVRQFKRFLEQSLLGGTTDSLLGCQNEEEFLTWLNKPNVKTADFALFCQISESLELKESGKTDGHLMSYGNYPIDDNKKPLVQVFTYYKGVTSLLNPSLITEDIHHAHYESDKTILTPWDSFSPPKMDKSEAYSWCKAPRLDGKAIEVGSLARQVISKQPLIKDLMEKYGSNVHTRIVARVVELVVIVGYVEKWLDEGFNKEVNFCEPSLKTTSSKGIGLIEAARGGLGHWIEVENEKIINFQVIAPTTWNFSPKDSKGTVGALEQALVGAKKLKNELEPVSVQHIVRSFDPCMVCTVH